MQRIRFGDYVQEASWRHNRVSFNDVAREWSASERLKLTAADVYTIVRPYFTVRFMEQVRAVVPLAVYLIAFQYLLLRSGVQGAGQVVGGLIAVIVGLMLFMEGLKLGLMPLGAALGETLPVRSPLWLVLSVVFLLGVGVTFAEPAIGALKAAGSIVDPTATPRLATLLNEASGTLVLLVGAGVGLAAVLGTLRFVYDWSLKPLIYASVVPCLVLTAYAHFRPGTSEIIGLAWDAGAVTTGPVTVPLVLALGIGVAASVGRGAGSLSGFGIVTLASLFPILGVLILGLLVDPASSSVASASVAAAWHETSPWVEVILAVRAILPLVLFLVAVMILIVRRPIQNRGLVTYGIVLALLGMMVFNLGLTYGLAEIGGQSGGLLPGTFAETESVSGSPLYAFAVGVGLVVAFAWVLGFGATLAEPALNALGLTVEELTNGAFPKKLLMGSVAAGVAVGIALGVAQLVFGWALVWFLMPGYGLLLVLTFFSTEEFVNVAWDSAGVTTGPVTVPLVLAMGLGLGEAVRAPDGFGVLAMASLCPIASVLLSGMYIQWRVKRIQTASGGQH